jgi:hypothetical protein
LGKKFGTFDMVGQAYSLTVFENLSHAASVTYCFERDKSLPQFVKVGFSRLSPKGLPCPEAGL